VAAAGSGDGLIAWLVGGLLLGGVVLGLLVGTHELGWLRGHSAPRAIAPAATTPPQTTATTSRTTSTTGASAVALGQQLFTADGCAGCHSLSGSNGVGPTLNGLAGSTVALSDGSTITADDAYLARSITEPDAQIVQGSQKGIMPAAIASFDLTGKPQDVAALVAFIKTQR
jgi:cytochrome c oxidase subunit 2